MWFILVSVAIVAVTVLIRNKYSYWERQGVPNDKPIIPYGSIRETALAKKDIGFVVQDLYNRYKGRFVGIYLLFKPVILIRDLELARQVLIQDFSSFHDRGTGTNIFKHLFAARGDSWKTLRAKLTPLFSTGKLKAMLSTVNDVSSRLLDHLNAQLADKSTVEVEMKSVMTNYAVDIIGLGFFGLDIDSYKDPDNEFRRINGEFITPSRWLERLYLLFLVVCQTLAKVMEFFGFKPTGTVHIRDIIKAAVNFREQNHVVSRDFLQLLLQLRTAGKINDDDNWSLQAAAEDSKSMSIETISDQCTVFYLAGSETTSITSAYTLYELSMYPELLKAAVVEVECVLAKHKLKPSDPVTYEAIKDMKFIELCICETLRKYPGLPFLNRECTKDFKIPDSDYTIKKGTAILISVLGLHYNPEYFPDPLKYDPYRFSQERHDYNPDAYMPFGEGPHQCIAKRMGLLNSKIAIVKVLANFNIAPNAHKEIEFEFNPGVVVIAKGGLMMKLSKKAQ